MFDNIFEAIEQWMRELLSGMISSNLSTMFTDVNEKTGEIAAQVGQTPQGWNGNIFSLIRNLSDSVIMPIAGMVITFVLCYAPVQPPDAEKGSSGRGADTGGGQGKAEEILPETAGQKSICRGKAGRKDSRRGSKSSGRIFRESEKHCCGGFQE